MSRQPSGLLVWREDDAGERAGPFTIRMDAPGRWQLSARGRSVGFYPTRTGARQAAAVWRRRQGLRRRFIGHLLIAGLSLVALAAALASRTEPNPEYLPARAIADEFDRAQLAVETGEIGIDQVGQVFAGIEGASFEHAGLLKLGLAGVFGGDCYGMTWRSGQRVAGVVLRTDYLTCEPDASLIDQPDPPGLVAESMRPAWDFALPDPERNRVWFIPLVTIGVGGLVLATTRAAALVFALRM